MSARRPPTDDEIRMLREPVPPGFFLLPTTRGLAYVDLSDPRGAAPDGECDCPRCTAKRIVEAPSPGGLE